MNLKDPKIKMSLQQAFIYDDLYQDNVKIHLNKIRQVIYQVLWAEQSEQDREKIIELVDQLIGINGQIILEKVDDWKFKIDYELLIVIGNLINNDANLVDNLRDNSKKDAVKDKQATFPEKKTELLMWFPSKSGDKQKDELLQQKNLGKRNSL